MVSRFWKVYGADGHRQRESFGKTDIWNFSTEGDIRIIGIWREDLTGTNDFAVLQVVRNTAEECEDELWGQISDGIFENSRVGRVEEILR